MTFLYNVIFLDAKLFKRDTFNFEFDISIPNFIYLSSITKINCSCIYCIYTTFVEYEISLVMDYMLFTFFKVSFIHFCVFLLSFILNSIILLQNQSVFELFLRVYSNQVLRVLSSLCLLEVILHKISVYFYPFLNIL